MISKNDLVGKYVTYLDGDGKRRTERVKAVRGSYVTVISVTKVKHRVHKDRVLGRQYRKKGLEKIDWSRPKKKGRVKK